MVCFEGSGSGGPPDGLACSCGPLLAALGVSLQRLPPVLQNQLKFEAELLDHGEGDRLQLLELLPGPRTACFLASYA